MVPIGQVRYVISVDDSELVRSVGSDRWMVLGWNGLTGLRIIISPRRMAPNDRKFGLLVWWMMLGFDLVFLGHYLLDQFVFFFFFFFFFFIHSVCRYGYRFWIRSDLASSKCLYLNRSRWLCFRIGWLGRLDIAPTGWWLNQLPWLPAPGCLLHWPYLVV
jgi:hypothetical protein